MQLTNRDLNALQHLDQGKPEFEVFAGRDASLAQSLRKRGLIERRMWGQGHQLTLTGKQALTDAQKGKK